MIDAEELLTRVAAEVGLDDFGDPSYREGLDQLLASVAADADLSPLGQAALEGQLTVALTNRLRVLDWARRHPDVTAAPIVEPLFTVGQPRTGTTALSHLLRVDPANRSLLAWEANDSVPPPTTATYATDPRFEAAKAAPDLIGELNPEFKAMHHDEPEDAMECVVLLNQHCASMQFSATFVVPAYNQWLLDTDLTPAYRYHRTALQVLQSRCPGRWQLKTPQHQLGIDALVAVYPDARLVWTHRDPVQVMGSLCSLSRSLSGTFSDVDHAAVIGRDWLHVAGSMVDRMLAHRDREGDQRFFDLPYKAIVADQVTAVRSIYDHFGMEITPAAAQAFTDHAARARQGRHGSHTYDLADFGLTDGQVRDRFAAYLDRYGDLL